MEPALVALNMFLVQCDVFPSSSVQSRMRRYLLNVHDQWALVGDHHTKEYAINRALVSEYDFSPSKCGHFLWSENDVCFSDRSLQSNAPP